MRGITKEGACAPPSEAQVTPCSQLQKRFVLIVAILGSTLGFIDGTIAGIIAPAIRADLDASLATISWVVNGYTLVLAAFILVGGSAGDVYGRRKIFGLGIAIFAGASLLCAIALTGWQLVGARLIQGFGAALMVPSSLALIAAYFPKEERGRAVGTWAAASAVAAAIGPLLGGAMVDTLGWRSTFFINLPLAAVTLYLLFYRVPPDRLFDDVPGLDWLGSVLATVGLGGLTLSLTLLNDNGVSTPVLLSGAIGIGGLVAFFYSQTKVEHPMMPLGLFALDGFAAVNLATFVLYAALGGLLFFLPITLLAAFDMPAVAVGSVFLPFTIVMAVLTPRVGALVDRLGVRMPLAVGSLIAGGSFWLSGFAVSSGSLFAIGGTMVVLGLGMALVIPPLSTGIINAVEENQSGVASGINNAVSRVGGLFAVAAFAPLGATAYARAMPEDVAGSGFASLAGADLTEAAVQAHQAANLSAYSTLALVAAVLCVCSALLVVALMRSPA